MKKSTKAILLSAFVFPGAGHFFLKKVLSGAVLAGASFAGIYYLILDATEKAFNFTEQLQYGDIQPDIRAITELLSHQTTGSEAQLLHIATTALIICWLIGIIDSYRVGRISDRQ